MAKGLPLNLVINSKTIQPEFGYGHFMKKKINVWHISPKNRRGWAECEARRFGFNYW